MRDFYKNNSHNNFILTGVSLDSSKTDFELYKRLIELAIQKNQQFPFVWRFDKQHSVSLGSTPSDPTHFGISSKGPLLF